MKLRRDLYKILDKKIHLNPNLGIAVESRLLGVSRRNFTGYNVYASVSIKLKRKLVEKTFQQLDTWYPEG